jgi:hypothetical protein
VVALTLPEDVVRGLHGLHPDLAWAIVTLFERRAGKASAQPAPPDTELVTIADRRSLIVVSRKTFTRLPGARMIPLDSRRAFLALDPGRGIADLELAVIDRLESRSITVRERKALDEFRLQLRQWRHDRALRFHPQAIIVVERNAARSARGSREAAT